VALSSLSLRYFVNSSCVHTTPSPPAKLTIASDLILAHHHIESGLFSLAAKKMGDTDF
jgi:hypothetical protein